MSAPWMSAEWCTQTAANVLAVKTAGGMKEEQVKETTLTYRLDTKQSIVSHATGCVSVSVTSCSDWSTNDPFVSLYEWSKWWKVSPGFLGHVVLIWRDTCHRLLEAMGSETKHPSDSGTSDRTNCRGELWRVRAGPAFMLSVIKMSCVLKGLWIWREQWLVAHEAVMFSLRFSEHLPVVSLSSAGPVSLSAPLSLWQTTEHWLYLASEHCWQRSSIQLS